MTRDLSRKPVTRPLKWGSTSERAQQSNQAAGVKTLWTESQARTNLNPSGSLCVHARVVRVFVCIQTPLICSENKNGTSDINIQFEFSRPNLGQVKLDRKNVAKTFGPGGAVFATRSVARTVGS